MNTRMPICSISACMAGLFSCGPLFANQSQPAVPVQVISAKLPPAIASESRDAMQRGVAFLIATQEANGAWTSRYGPAITAIAAQAIIQSPRHGPKHPAVQRALHYVRGFVQADGGVYQPEMKLENYQTSVVLMMLASLKDPAHQRSIADAQDFLRTLQYDDPEKIRPDNPWYGGAGYNSRKRPDLSNTQMMLEAMHQSGLPADDPVYRKALTFISRCQMSAETNDQPFAKGSDDGGFIYTPVDAESKAGSESKGLFRSEPRSYGTMTYSAFKSMIYAKVKRDDPRVQKAHRWIKRNWTLDENPNMPAKQAQQGLYYYYHVFAKAMHAWGEPVIVDDRGVSHAWRVELCRKLISLQNKDGSWVNEADRWEEGDANYVTALAVMALQEALAD